MPRQSKPGFRCGIAQERFYGLQGDAKVLKFAFCFLRGGSFEFVDDREKIQEALFADAAGAGELGPGVAIADANYEIFLAQTKAAQGVDDHRQQFGVGGGRGFSDNVAVELIEFPEPAAALAFVAETVGDREPFERFPEVARPCGDHAREGGSHFRP